MLGQIPKSATAIITQNASWIVLYRIPWKCGRQLDHCIGLGRDVCMTYSSGSGKRIERQDLQTYWRAKLALTW